MMGIDLTIYGCILVATLFIALFLSIFVLYKENKKQKTKISFKEGLDLAELPIVTFTCNEQKLHFLLDTGSNISYITKSVLDNVPNKSTGYKTSTIGVGGKIDNNPLYTLTIGYKDQRFTENFAVVPLEETFKAIEEESGIKLHGILGNKFFEKYKYILDFKELVAYR